MDLSFPEKLKAFLEVTTNEEILNLYRIEQNYNAGNIADIDKQINVESVGSVQSGTNKGIQGPKITEESRKKLAKSLIN